MKKSTDIGYRFLRIMEKEGKTLGWNYFTLNIFGGKEDSNHSANKNI